MNETTMTKKGQVTVPKEIREKFGWAEGTKLKFYIDGNEVKLKSFDIVDGLEDLIVADLEKEGYIGDQLKAKLFERKEQLDRAFDRLLEERLREETTPLKDVLKELENEL